MNLFSTISIVFMILLFVKSLMNSNIFFCSGHVNVLIGWANCSSLPFIRGVGVRLLGREKRVGERLFVGQEREVSPLGVRLLWTKSREIVEEYGFCQLVFSSDLCTKQTNLHNNDTHTYAPFAPMGVPRGHVCGHYADAFRGH